MIKVDLQCPLCDDGVLTATVSPDSIDDLEDAGCGHAANSDSYQLSADIWQAVADKDEGARLDAEESRYQNWRDR